MIVTPNPLVSAGAQLLREAVDAGDVYLKLFANDFTPTPASVLASYTEANFNGYADILTADEWGAIVKIVDGQYQFVSSEFTFSAVAGANQTVYGWYLANLTDVILSARLPNPFLFVPGAALTLIITPQSFSLSIL